MYSLVPLPMLMYSWVARTTLCHENNKHVRVLKLRDGKERGKPRSKGHTKNFDIREFEENMCMVSYFFLNWRPQEPQSWRHRMEQDLSGTNSSREASSKCLIQEQMLMVPYGAF